ncbi:MarR family winged helix-turn-helix transcriptional regulator [Listeria seeligeri]|uniref:MarR family winged helix-turn-helix transcriptional regulator n=1 Tax=Listeria seeligeri TaxID=1640 RepID=UPI001629CFBE|nr:winged helix DNA-binding protein [Listeria seeligeri]MBC1480332.1 winged helix DNA-binding protein [Listeria seeligeri]MBC1721551.1 winged helix DNA-binding protein [Listeria seeligeri]MBC1858632.1 winged helix DNA-binding protein [Listeria seeligeri]
MQKLTFEQFNQLHLIFINIDRLINEVIEEKNINISREQIGVFKLLMKYKKMTLKEIADKQRVFKTAISKRVKKLEEKGFVKQTISSDKREKVIMLTEEGHQFYERRQIMLYEGMMEKLDINEEDMDELYIHVNKINNILKKEEKNDG